MDGRWIRPWIGSLCRIGEESQILFEQYISPYSHYEEPKQMDLPQLELQLRSASRRIYYNPYMIETRIARAELLLKLRFPELAVADAHKALLLTDKATTDTWPGRSNSSLRTLKCQAFLLLTQALFFAGCYVECRDLISNRSEKDKRGKERDFKRLLRYTNYALRLEYKHHAQEEDFMEASRRHQYNVLRQGEVQTVVYPWIPDHLFRRTVSTIEKANSELQQLSKGRVAIRKTQLCEGVRHSNQDAYGIFAMADISAGSQLFLDRTMVCASSGRSRCPACCAELKEKRSTFWASGELCCDFTCARRLEAACRPGVLNRWSKSYQRTRSLLSEPPRDEDQALFFRVLAIVHKYTQDHSSSHPLQAWPVNRLTASYHGGATRVWSYIDNVCRPFEVLQRLGVDVFEDTLSEAWVLETIAVRIATNARGVESKGDQIAAINPLYSFFNHSCRPNVVTLVDETNATSSLRMVAKKTIAKGSELFISYLTNEELRESYESRKQLLSSWTGGDCQCRRCARRRERAETTAACSQAESVPRPTTEMGYDWEEEEAVMTNSEESSDEDSDGTSLEF